MDKISSANSNESNTHIAKCQKLAARVGKCLRAEFNGQQEFAIQKTEEAVFNRYAFPKEQGVQTLISYFGPPGFDGIKMAETVGKELNLPIVKIGLGNYTGKDAAMIGTGSSRKYSNSEYGTITEKIRNNPASLLILDGFGLQNESLNSPLYDLFSKGYMYDNHYEEYVDFSHCFVVIISDIAASIYKKHIFNYSDIDAKTIAEAIRREKNESGAQKIPDSMISELLKYYVIPLNPPNAKALLDIATEAGNNYLIRIQEEYPSIKIECDKKEMAEMLIFGNCGDYYEGHAVAGATDKFISTTIHNVIANLDEVEKDIGLLSNIKYNFNLSDMPKEINDIKDNTENRKIGYFSSSAKSSAIIESNSIKSEEITSVRRFDSIDYESVIIEFSKENAAEANAVFNIAIQEQDIPVYVFNFDGLLNSAMVRDLYARGAMGVFCENAEMYFNDWLTNIDEAMTLHNIYSLLSTSGKKLSYNINYSYQIVDGKIEASISIVNYHLIKHISCEAEGKLLSDIERPNTKFSDVIGLENTVKEFDVFLDYLKNYKKYTKEGKRMPKGALLIGPPGTGKTKLARALAGESGLPIISINVSELSSPYYGIAENEMARTFELARENAPCIILIDEVDAIARVRGRSLEIKQEEKVLNVLLAEMDGLKQNRKRPVFVIAATNIYDLDSAFKRRFDIIFQFTNPNLANRKKLLQFFLSNHANNLEYEEIDFLAERLIGKSPADIESLIEYAGRKASNDIITIETIDDAFELLEFGETIEWDEDSIRQTATHEAGHAIISRVLGNTPTYISIISRGDHGGYILQGSDENKMTISKQKILDKICVTMAGRAAECAMYGENGITSGFSGDIDAARTLARLAVTKYAMYEDMFVYVGEAESESTKRMIDSKVNEILGEQYRRAFAIIKEKEDVLKDLVKELIIKRNMVKKDIETFFNNTLKEKERLSNEKE